VANLVIVAIPAADDPVWAVSSEKAPHLTILFLGDAVSNPNVAKIVEYVKERARQLEPFNLLVDHRGTLGSDEADVLFFTKEIPWQLIDFRETLKYNQEIQMAYNAIPQRTDWKPHLTLGYPDTPAHLDDWDPMGTQYVSFDKVAVWYGDSEGSEFVLTENPRPTNWSEQDMAMSDAGAQAVTRRGGHEQHACQTRIERVARHARQTSQRKDHAPQEHAGPALRQVGAQRIEAAADARDAVQ